MRTVGGRTDRVVVVGAGLSGLSAALQLAGRGRTVTVLERETFAGGRMGRLDINGYRLEVRQTINDAEIKEIGRYYVNLDLDGYPFTIGMTVPAPSEEAIGPKVHIPRRKGTPAEPQVNDASSSDADRTDDQDSGP